MDSVERAVALVAQAYGIGPLLAVWNSVEPEPGPEDDMPGEFLDSMSIAKRTETMEQAGRAIHPNPLKQLLWFKGLPAIERKSLLEWNEAAAFRMRGRGVDHRVGEFLHWSRTVGAVVLPRTRPAHRVFIALSDAALSGPLEHWLALVATQQVRFWPKVRMHMVAAGYPEWAADEAARGIVIGRREWLRERAKTHHMRAKDFSEEVRRAECRLLDWLQQAATGLLRAYETPTETQLNYGQQSGHKPDSLWHPERESETATKGRNSWRGTSPDIRPRAPVCDKAGNNSEFEGQRAA